MKITCLQLGAYATNCYIVWDEATGRAAVIDPGDDCPAIASALARKNLTVGLILLTHGHFDHTGAVDALREQTGAPVYMHRADLSLDRQVMDVTKPFCFYDEGDTVSLDALQFRVLHTPGHTPGSVCLVCGEALFSGDTLFCGSCGRTDFPGGSWDDMEHSLARLYALPGNYTVLPGHESLTMLADERVTNPFMRQALADLKTT